MNEKIEAALNSNSNISEQVKENIMFLSNIFHKNFKEVNLDNYIEKLKTIKIEAANKYAHKMPFIYNTHKNEAKISKKSLEESDAKNILMQLLLNIITSKDEYYGLNSTGTLEFINQGITEIIANNLVGNESDVSYNESSVTVTNIIGIALGEGLLINSYFKNDGETIIKYATKIEGDSYGKN